MTAYNLKKLQDRQLLPADPDLVAVAETFAVAVTDDVLATIDAADPADPVARQYLPDARELRITPDELEDPIGDDAHSPVKGVVHRYPDRVLLKAVNVCAVYCRFCFRREMVGPGQETLTDAELDTALAYIKNAPHVWEVILTGGDPLVLSPRRIKTIMTALDDIPHVQVVRVHTRVPVADPARVTDAMVEALSASKKAVYVVYHVNHANELTEKVRAVTEKFIRAGIPLLSQSVLLKGVNADAGTLENLFRKLVAFKIKPYYLHHPDKAKGTGHFRLTLEEGQQIFAALQGRLSGVALPKYILDIPGGAGKVNAAAPALAARDDGYDVENYRGKTYHYTD